MITFCQTLYGKDSKGGIKEWTVTANGDEVHVTHGKLDGKLQTKVTVCKPKNVGRANETTASIQATLEAESKFRKQLDKLYRPTIEELSEVGNTLPMLAHDYTRVGHRINFPCDVSAKLDGVRCITEVTPETLRMTSRGGKPYNVPHQVYEELVELYGETGVGVLDGEIYKHGLALQDIVSAVKKDNPNTSSLEYWIFDVPSDLPWEERREALANLQDKASELELKHIKFVLNVRVETEDEGRQVMNHYLERGFEGMMLRNLDGRYKFNHRSPDLQKWKDFYDLEAKVIEVTRDKLDEGVLMCEMQNGKTFECKMKGAHVYRAYGSMLTLKGAWITVKYQQFTNDGIPQFPVGLSVRECDDQGYPQV